MKNQTLERANTQDTLVVKAENRRHLSKKNCAAKLKYFHANGRVGMKTSTQSTPHSTQLFDEKQ